MWPTKRILLRDHTEEQCIRPDQAKAILLIRTGELKSSLLFLPAEEHVQYHSSVLYVFDNLAVTKQEQLIGEAIGRVANQILDMELLSESC